MMLIFASAPAADERTRIKKQTVLERSLHQIKVDFGLTIPSRDCNRYLVCVWLKESEREREREKNANKSDPHFSQRPVAGRI